MNKIALDGLLFEGGPLAFRNKVDNGGFSVNQRVVSGTVTLGAGAYGHDRWKAGASGCTYTFATSNGLTTLTISAGSLQQVIEDVNIPSGSNTMVMSWTGTAQGKIAAGAYSASGVTATVTGGSNLTIEFGTGTLTKVQLELGTTPTPYEQRPYALQLLMCQRYYQRVGTGLTGVVDAATQCWFGITFPVPMRAAPSAPTVLVTNPTCRAGSGNVTATGAAVYFSVLQAGGANIGFNGFSGLTAGQILVMQTDSVLAFSADL